MNTSLVESPPAITFQEISIHQDNWRERFFELIRKKKPITYEVDNMPNIAEDISNELNKNGYHVEVLNSNQDRYFLVPN